MKQTSEETIEIPLNKQRLIILLVSAVAFCGIGIWFTAKPDSFKNGLLGNPTIVSAIGMLSIVVFGLSAIVVVKKITDNKPGLIIDKSGITDNSTGVAAGLIPWKEIKEIKTTKIINQKFITIVLNTPQAATKPVKTDGNKKGSAKSNDNTVTPINIAITTLKYDFNELETILKTAFDKYKKA